MEAIINAIQALYIFITLLTSGSVNEVITCEVIYHYSDGIYYENAAVCVHESDTEYQTIVPIEKAEINDILLVAVNTDGEAVKAVKIHKLQH